MDDLTLSDDIVPVQFHAAQFKHQVKAAADKWPIVL